MKNSQKFDLRKFLNENKISTGTHKSKNLIIEDFRNLMPEAGGTQDDKYVHIGYGKYKEKGKEKETGASTFTKDDSGKYIPAGDSKDGGEKAGGEEKPKVNIFDKPEPKETEPKKSEKDLKDFNLDTDKDYFEHYEELPPEAGDLNSEMGEKLAEDGLSWEEAKVYLEKFRKLGYEFDYGMDGEPFGLRKIGEYKPV